MTLKLSMATLCRGNVEFGFILFCAAWFQARIPAADRKWTCRR